MDFHPAANLFPLMNGDEFTALVRDIAEHGQREPIILHEGMILDGRNRYRACAELGLKPECREWCGDDPLAYVVSLNLHRRHLTREQRDEVIRNLRGQGMKLQEIAGAIGVGIGTVHRAVGSELFQLEKLIGADGKARPAHYTPHQVEPETDVEEADDGEYNRQQIIEANRAGWCIEVPETASTPRASRPENLHVSDDSYEWFTPAEYIEAARRVMGRIDTDPASCVIANGVIRASIFYTTEDDGLLQPWPGNVWLNPPYNMPWIERFVDKALAEYAADDSRSIMVLTNNSTDTAWFHKLLAAGPVCFTRGRIRFWGDNGDTLATRQGQAIFYIGNNRNAFIREFSAFGAVMELHNDHQ